MQGFGKGGKGGVRYILEARGVGQSKAMVLRDDVSPPAVTSVTD
jgi:hypothetical protein